ncbi:MAG: hypothetical protein OXD46_07145 [Chloroflexi bacterium]|nr:hypothetical protein [Chloroflexota bacterium]
MPDTLHRAIGEAIAQPLDGATFERCAVDLLRDYYPTLRPVEGGNDAGMDGIGELADSTPFFLVATVQQDVRGNLERSVKSHIDAGGERRVVVFATSRTVTGRRWLELDQQLRHQFGVRLAAVHGRADFIAGLYRNAAWRRKLLGVPGQARALSQLPATRRPTPEIPLVGRDQELEQLKTIESDVVVIGKPGIGKTFLLQQLMDHDWGLFDDGWAIQEVEDAVLDMQPSRIVVDDAHLNGDRLIMLRQLRTQMSTDFTIAAVTWPGRVEEVSGALPGAAQFEIKELERDQILRVIEEMGILGPVALQAHLVDQARGRVGLAVTLAHASLAGGLREVTSGDVLRRDIVEWYSRSIGVDSRYVLGFLALSGRYGVTLAQVGRALGIALPRVSELIRGLASGGTLDEAYVAGQVVRLRVQPEDLRYALVRDVYLSGAGSLDLSASLRHLDDVRQAAAPLLGAIHRGAELDHNFVRDLVDDRDSESAVAFALLGAKELQEALELWPQFRAEIIRQAHRAEIAPNTTLTLLLESAVGDYRPEHNSPNHPLRAIGDHIAASDRPVEVRKAAIEAIDGWLQAGGDVGIGIRALAHAIRPQRRRTHQDPGLGNTITIMEAPLPPEIVAGLAPLWDRVLGIVEREKDGPVGPLIAELHSWVFPRTLAPGGSSFEAAERAIRGVAPRVIEELANILAERPGVLRQLSSYGVVFDLEIAIPREFEALFPQDRRSEDYEEWQRSADAAVVALAQDLESRPIDEKIEVLHGSDLEATTAGITYPRLTPRLAQLFAESNAEPLTWVDALVRRQASPDLLVPFLRRSINDDVVGCQGVLTELLDDDWYSWAALQIILTHPVDEDLKTKGISRLGGEHHDSIEWLLVRGEVDAETVERLLDAPNPVVARDSAIAIACGEGKTKVTDLSEAGQARWREVFLAGPPDESWYSEILKRDPALFAEWLCAWYGRLESGSTAQRILPHTLVEGIRRLPMGVRRDLIEAIPAHTVPYPLEDIVTELVGTDLDTMEALLDRSDLKDIHWVSLRRGPSEPWMERALFALNRGWRPEAIVGATTSSESLWSGEDSHHWQEKVDAYSNLDHKNDNRRGEIIDAGMRIFSNFRDRAAESEREERIFGLNHRG